MKRFSLTFFSRVALVVMLLRLTSIGLQAQTCTGTGTMDIGALPAPSVGSSVNAVGIVKAGTGFTPAALIVLTSQ